MTKKKKSHIYLSNLDQTIPNNIDLNEDSFSLPSSSVSMTPVTGPYRAFAVRGGFSRMV